MCRNGAWEQSNLAECKQNRHPVRMANRRSYRLLSDVILLFFLLRNMNKNIKTINNTTGITILGSEFLFFRDYHYSYLLYLFDH